MARHFASLVAITLLLVPASAAGAPSCTCRYEGRDMPEGSVVCIDLASGRYLARCGKRLNNSAWIRLSEGCPSA